MTKRLTIGIIGGAGWLGGAIARGLVAAGFANPSDLVLSYRSSRPSFLSAATWTSDNQALVDAADVVVLSVRPVDWPLISVHASGKLAVSVMAGVPLETLRRGLGTNRVVRSMPNAAAEVRHSFTPWVAGEGVSDADRRFIAALFATIGPAAEVETEEMLDYFTGFTGSGPAFPALLADAMVRDAVSRGIDADLARRAAIAVVVGAGRLFDANDTQPSEIVREFVAYGGTTCAAIEAMRASSFEAAVQNGLMAARDRCASLTSG